MSSPSKRSTVSRSSTQSATPSGDAFSDLAAPLPSSPAVGAMGPPSVGPGGPGSVRVSEIDLSSPLNYGTPSSAGSSLKTPRTGVQATPIRVRPDIQSARTMRQVPLSLAHWTCNQLLQPSSSHLLKAPRPLSHR